MLARLSPQPTFSERRTEQRHLAVVLPFLRTKASEPDQTGCFSKYPCTRMHGAVFEAEFYPAVDEQS